MAGSTPTRAANASKPAPTCWLRGTRCSSTRSSIWPARFRSCATVAPAEIKFGTDGWRGIIADDFTFANVHRVAQATADYWNSHTRGESAAMVGYDNRFLSEVYAKLVCEVFAANGIKALYPPVAVPTPAVSYAVRDRNLCGAVMITASHNPPQFNGYKLKAEFAGPATPEICQQVEKRVDQSPARFVRFDEAVKTGGIEIYDPRPRHIAAVKKIVDLDRIRRA